MKAQAPTTVNILPKSGNLYKINLHAHTTVSDGKFTPEQIKKLYMDHGYSAVAFTDHRICKPHNELTDENFVALTGVEVDFSSTNEAGKLWQSVHINALARNPDKERSWGAHPYTVETVNEVIDDLNADNFVVTLNHPVRSAISTDEVIGMKGYRCMELFNSLGEVCNYRGDSTFYEHFLRAGGRAIPVAADDSHQTFEDGTPFREYFQGFTVVKADKLDYDSIVNAIECGNSFASTGPMFENIWLEGDILHVECSPVGAVFVRSKYLNVAASKNEPTDSITSVELDISHIREFSPYMWVQLRDTNGGIAWATPYWFGGDK